MNYLHLLAQPTQVYSVSQGDLALLKLKVPVEISAASLISEQHFEDEVGLEGWIRIRCFRSANHLSHWVSLNCNRYSCTQNYMVILRDLHFMVHCLAWQVLLLGMSLELTENSLDTFQHRPRRGIVP